MDMESKKQDILKNFVLLDEYKLGTFLEDAIKFIYTTDDKPYDLTKAWIWLNFEEMFALKPPNSSHVRKCIDEGKKLNTKILNNSKLRSIIDLIFKYVFKGFYGGRQYLKEAIELLFKEIELRKENTKDLPITEKDADKIQAINETMADFPLLVTMFKNICDKAHPDKAVPEVKATEETDAFDYADINLADLIDMIPPIEIL